MIESSTNLVSYPYCIILEFKKNNLLFVKYLRKTKFVNFHSNNIGNRYI